MRDKKDKSLVIFIKLKNFYLSQSPLFPWLRTSENCSGIRKLQISVSETIFETGRTDKNLGGRQSWKEGVRYFYAPKSACDM